MRIDVLVAQPTQRLLAVVAPPRPAGPVMGGGAADWLAVTAERNAQRAAVAPRRDAWGWLPLLALTMASGLLLTALADKGGRDAATWADPVFWAGICLLFFPPALRLTLPFVARGERIGLLVTLGMAVYLVKVFEHPTSFALFDEFQHWRTAQDIVATGHLFSANPLLPISPNYPGMEIVTTALSSLTGLPLFGAGVAVVGMARLLLMLALYLLYEQISHSQRVAGLATLVFMANPLFLFFDAQFAYESLAMPLAVIVFYCVTRYSDAPKRHRAGWIAAVGIGLVAVVVTHHLTSLMLIVLLALWTTVVVIRNRRGGNKGSGRDARAYPIVGALLGIGIVVAWVLYVGDAVVAYLSPSIVNAVQGLAGILAGSSAPRQLFQDGTGTTAPIWERIVSFGAVGLIVAGLLYGWSCLWRHHRSNTTALALGIAALAYPVSQMFRLTANGSEVASRPMDFLFLAVAFVLGVGGAWLTSPDTVRWRRSGALASVLTVAFVGGIIAGAGPMWERLPGPYLASSDQRSISPQGIAAATWTYSALGPGQRFATDHVDQWLVGSYGGQMPVNVANSPVDESYLFFDNTFSSDDESIVSRGHIHYLLVDTRFSTDLPGIGYYYETYEPNAFHHTQPIPLTALTKFDNVQNVSRVFDNGAIVIYDTGAYSNG